MPDRTKFVVAGSADPPVDHTADAPSNGTMNTHPQSPTPQGNLSKEDKENLFRDANKPGVSLGLVAEKYKVTPERVNEVIDELNAKRKK